MMCDSCSRTSVGMLSLNCTKPNPLLFSPSRITFASATAPKLEKYSRNVWPVVEGLRPPTKILHSVHAGFETADLVDTVSTFLAGAVFSGVVSGMRTNLNPGGTCTDWGANVGIVGIVGMLYGICGICCIW